MNNLPAINLPYYEFTGDKFTINKFTLVNLQNMHMQAFQISETTLIFFWFFFILCFIKFIGNHNFIWYFEMSLFFRLAQNISPLLLWNMENRLTD